jgi:hypothetical protein
MHDMFIDFYFFFKFINNKFNQELLTFTMCSFLLSSPTYYGQAPAFIICSFYFVHPVQIHLAKSTYYGLFLKNEGPIRFQC